MKCDNEKILYIMLTQIRGLGPIGQHNVLSVMGDPARCFDNAYVVRAVLEQEDCPKRYIDSLLRRRDESGLREKAERIIDDCDNKGITIVTAGDQDYPERFRSLPEMPKVLFAKGDLRVNDYKRSFGIIGARRCTHEGKEKAIRIAEEAALCGAAVISGMAKGIDSYAQTAAVKADGYTIAVLGSGPDLCYPKEHTKLYESICHTGCVLSETPPGVEPRRYMFPRRNRLIAALSDELFVIDAGRNSGTESTVAAAERYNRRIRKFFSSHVSAER